MRWCRTRYAVVLLNTQLFCDSLAFPRSRLPKSAKANEEATLVARAAAMEEELREVWKAL